MDPRPAPIVDHPVRDQVLSVIRDRPGISVSELARAVGAYRTTIAFHVDRLRAAGLVRAVHAGRRVVLFASERDATWDDLVHALLSEPACRVVAAALVERPGARAWELCDQLDMSERAVYHHVHRLVAAGLVETVWRGAHRGLAASPRLVVAMQQMKEDRRDRAIPDPAEKERAPDRGGA